MNIPTTQTTVVKCVKLAEIDTSLAVRDGECPNTVKEYAEAMRDTTNKFPPIVVFETGKGKLLCADGSHRVSAARSNEFLDITAEVRQGSRSDALKYALGANVAHGLRRTNADKRRCVELALREWPKVSNEEIARICAVSAPLVAEVRTELENNSKILRVEKRVGKDGKKRTAPKPKRAAAPKVVAPAGPTGPRDDMGLEIPEVCRATWNTRDEVGNWIAMVKSIFKRVKKLQEDHGDFLFYGKGVVPQSLMSHLENALSDLNGIYPYVVCTCLGKQGDKCGLCGGKGLLSEFKWGLVAEETRNMRVKMIESFKQEGK